MNLSGIVVGVSPEHLDRVADALEALPNVEVFIKDTKSGRIVVVQEAPGIEGEIDGLRRIQEMPHVAMAELVYHYFGDDPSLVGADDDTVLGSLNDDSTFRFD